MKDIKRLINRIKRSGVVKTGSMSKNNAWYKSRRLSDSNRRDLYSKPKVKLS